MSDLVGRTLGSYQIVAALGHGGMGDVYRAVQPSIGREVAIKVLPAHLLQDRTFLERFNREVQIIARLQHPRILPVHDFGQDGDRPYIVMTYMSGGTLADRIRQAPAGLPLAETARLVSQIAEGLDYAHEQEIIHRDFKPSNVLLDQKGNIYLADFGIARVIEDASRITASGSVGTPAYMAPEVSTPGNLTPLIDVYALGVTLFEMLSGHHPFTAETPMGVLLAHATEPVPEITSIVPDLPPAIQSVIDRAMSKQPTRRYQSAGMLASDLAHIAGVSPTNNQEHSWTDDAGTVPISSTPTPRPARRFAIPRWGWIVAAVLALAIIVFGGLTLAGVFGGESGLPSGPNWTQQDILEGHADKVNSVAFANDGKTLATASADGTIILWDVPSGDQLRELNGHDRPVLTVAFSPTEPTLASGSADNSIILWDLRTGEQLLTLSGHSNDVLSVAFSADGATLASASLDNSVIYWDVRTGALLRSLEQHSAATSIAFSPDRVTVASGAADNTIILVDLRTGGTLRTLTGHTEKVSRVSFSPDGSMLASSSTDGTVILWDVAYGEALHTLSGHTSTVTSVAISPDGSMIASGPQAGPIIIWDATTGQKLRELDGQPFWISDLAFSPDGIWLASASWNKTIILWMID